MDEFVIEWLRGQNTASVTAPNGSALKNRVQKLAVEHPEDCVIMAENKDGSIFAHVPVKYIKLSAPPKISEEMREERRTRMAKIRPNSALNDSDEDLPIED